LLLITYAIVLLIGEAIRDVRYAEVAPDAINLFTEPDQSVSPKCIRSQTYLLNSNGTDVTIIALCARFLRASYTFLLILISAKRSDLLSEVQ
jgi:hypothetical protein